MDIVYKYKAADLHMRSGVYTELSYPYSLLVRYPIVEPWFDDEAGIRVVFVQHFTCYLSNMNVYVFQTYVPYTGPSDNSRPNPDPEFVLAQKSLNSRWSQLTFMNPFASLAYILDG